METNTFLQIGKIYIFRTVTMIYVGQVKEIRGNEILVENCSWVAETSRWNEFVKLVNPRESEVYTNDVILFYSSMLDITECHKYITESI
jgi:hypothetical protein